MRSTTPENHQLIEPRRWYHHVLLWLCEKLGAPPLDIELWDGFTINAHQGSAIGTIQITNIKTLLRLVYRPELGFGDAYSSGELVIKGDLTEVLSVLYEAAEMSRIPAFCNLDRLIPKARTDISTAQHNIHHHYDLSNQFYQLWLDREMQYTCAYFSEASMSIAAAQQAKLDHVCRKLQLQPGQHVVEAGCGWGGLARHMALHYDVQVIAYNISKQQLAFARKRAKREGYDDRVNYVEADCRDMQGDFDAFVSIGMLEHIGTDQYSALADAIARVLKPHGRGLLHSIGRNRPRPMNYWIEKRIFPGAYPPTLQEMMPIFQRGNFAVLDVENLRRHYEKTLQCWLDDFTAHQQEVLTLFDDAFIRSWRMYLCGSIAAFHTGSLQLFQVTFANGQDNSVPWTRQHLYPQ